MSWSTRARRTRVAGLVVAVALAAALVAVLVDSGRAPGPVTGERDRNSQGAQTGRAARTVVVMTRNLYLGADLGAVLGALATGDDDTVVDATTRAWQAVRASRPRERMAAVAEEIAAADPAVVGLQEVATWTTSAYDPRTGTAGDPAVAYDFLALLLEELAARGAAYEPVDGATTQGFASPSVPVRSGPRASVPTRAVSLADRDVVLRRADVNTTHARVGTFTTLSRFPFGGVDLPVPRSWASVDVDAGGARFRFVNAHLEAFAVPGVDAERLRVAQVEELAAAQRRLADELGALPAVWVGDYNSDAPDGAAYSRLVEVVGRDAWRDDDGRAGATCCFDAAVRDAGERLDRRIDLVLVGPGVVPVRARVVGEEARDRTPSGRWSSDHAGVVARVVVPATR